MSSRRSSLHHLEKLLGIMLMSVRSIGGKYRLCGSHPWRHGEALKPSSHVRDPPDTLLYQGIVG
jgi:hypothetical protein